MSDKPMKKRRINVRFPAGSRHQKASARRTATSESDGSLTAYDRAKKAGLIGVVRGANRDLSTNRRHFSGFGS